MFLLGLFPVVLKTKGVDSCDSQRLCFQLVFYSDVFVFSLLCWFKVPFLYYFFFLLSYGYLIRRSFTGGRLNREGGWLTSLLFMSLVVGRVVGEIESSPGLLFFSTFLVLICFLFFLSSSFILFYFSFEMALFPIFLSVLFYGGQVEKMRAGYFLLFYTSFFALPFFYLVLIGNRSSLRWRFFVGAEISFLCSLAFLVKLPVFFFHYWLPRAHVEAPTTSSILLAGLLLKLGGVGIYRIFFFFESFGGVFWYFLAVCGCFFSPLLPIFQRDLKKFAAYSSVVHMNFAFFMTLRMRTSSFSFVGLLLLTHGYLSSLLFCFIGEVYYSSGSRILYYFSGGGFYSYLMLFSFAVLVFSNRGVPPFTPFFSELIGLFSLSFSYSFSIFSLFFFLFFGFYYQVFFYCQRLMGDPYNFFDTNSFSFCTILIWAVSYPTFLILL